MQGYLGRAFRTFLNPPAVLSNIDRRRALKKDCQPSFYWCDDDIAGIQVQTRPDAAYRPAGGAPSANRGCPERVANRASTGVAAIVRGSSGPVHPDTVSQPAGGVPSASRPIHKPNRVSTQPWKMIDANRVLNIYFTIKCIQLGAT